MSTEAVIAAASIAVTSSGADAIAFEARDAEGRVISIARMDAVVFGRLLDAARNVWPMRGLAETSITLELMQAEELKV